MVVLFLHMLSLECGDVNIFVRIVRNCKFLWFTQTLDIWCSEQNFAGQWDRALEHTHTHTHTQTHTHPHTHKGAPGKPGTKGISNSEDDTGTSIFRLEFIMLWGSCISQQTYQCRSVLNLTFIRKRLNLSGDWRCSWLWCRCILLSVGGVEF
jgi:hypothetical protein